MRNRKGWRRTKWSSLVPGQRCFRFFARNPHHVFKLICVEGDCRIDGFGNTGDHQLRPAKRPRLACHITDGAGRYSGFLVQFASYRFFNTFARFEKSGKRGVIAGRKAGLASDQCLAFIFGKHDHDRVRPREMLGLAGRAATPPACAKHFRGPAATAAIAVRIVPIDHGPSRTIDGCFFRRQKR